MTQFMFISQWVMLAAIFAITFWDSYRAHRITRFTVYFTWVLLVLHAYVFSTYGMSVGGSESDHFPEGAQTMAFLVMGWFSGLMIGVLAVGTWRVFHGVPLFEKDSEFSDKVR